MNGQFKLFRQPELKNPSLLVSWNEDASQIGTRVTDYLGRKLSYQSLAEIELVEFFPLSGVVVEENVVQFPESRFYLCPGSDLIVLRSDPPSYEWHKFLDLVLDIAQNYYHVKEVYTIGGMISLSAHTTPRQLLAVFNSPELKQALRQYSLASEMYYKTPPGQRPTLSSFLLWTAKGRNIPGVNLWVPIPFYLLAAGDPTAQKKTIEFLNQRFGWRIDLSDLDEEARQQSSKLAEMRRRFPEIDQLVTRLESNLSLSQEENENLVKEVDEFLNEGS